MTVLLSEVFGRFYDGLCQKVGKIGNSFQLMTVLDIGLSFFSVCYFEIGHEVIDLFENQTFPRLPNGPKSIEFFVIGRPSSESIVHRSHCVSF